MKEGQLLKPKIIIKKVKKGDHGGGHGGSWKVAYADFVTAMMAFFLLLWLITMVAPEKRARVAAYFKQFSLFDKSGETMFLQDPGGVTGEGGGAFEKMEKSLSKGINDVMGPDDLKKKLSEDIGRELKDVKDQITVDITDEGVRIQLLDKEGRPMFERGGSQLSPNAVKIMAVIADNIKPLENRIVIEGHTDALSYLSNRYTNWELSTERASSARNELEHDGLNPDRLAMVAGYAATRPIIKEDPNDPRNRRISIILLYPKGGKPYKQKELGQIKSPNSNAARGN